MIYTLGFKTEYDKYIKDDLNAGKRNGGSVWRKISDAKAYLDNWAKNDPNQANLFSIYAVYADWEKDTYHDDNGDYLNKDAKLAHIGFVDIGIQEVDEQTRKEIFLGENQ